jgi:hypothetical protein
MLVLEHALEYKKFLTAAMHMRWKMASWCVAYNRRSARDLVTVGKLIVSQQSVRAFRKHPN